MREIDPRVVACARALWAADGLTLLDGSPAPFPQGTPHGDHLFVRARAVIDEWLKQGATEAMVDAAKTVTDGRAQGCAISYTAMCEQARKEIVT